VWVHQVSELATALADKGIWLDPFPLEVDEAADALRPFAGALATQSETTARAVAHEPFAAACDLSFRYPRSDRLALDNVNLQILTGEVTAIVGANGAGKSTLARHFVRILPPPPGRIFIRRTDLSRLTSAEAARSVGYVFQYPEHQFVGRSVLDDVTYGLRRADVPEAQALGVARALLEEFGLDAVAAAHPYSLSHGEQRRLSVAAMLALGQHCLFLDEPTFGQDRRNAYLLFDKLLRLAGDDRAAVAITHDMRLVAEIAERALVMSEGRVIFDGSPSELFSDSSLLEQARLRPPPITRVGHLLGLRKPVLRVGELVDLLAPAEVAAR
jgi:energy-coupling factor transport system ATP-binding protein